MSIKLRTSILEEINKSLENTRIHLSAIDFSIHQSDGELRIVYNYDSKYFIKFSFSDKEEEYTVTEKTATMGGMSSKTTDVTKKDHLIYGNSCPGRMVEEETFNFYGGDNISRHVEHWVTYIWEDISANPLIRAVNSDRTELEKFLSSFNFDHLSKDEFFSDDEISDIKEKLNKVESDLAEELKKAIKDTKKLKKEISDLKKEFDTFRQTVKNHTKKAWSKSTISKIYVWFSKRKNLRMLETITKIGTTLIP